MSEDKTPMCDCNTIHSGIIARVKNEMPDFGELNRLAELYKCFADGTRVKILWALCISEMCVCDLAALFGMTISAVSHQLKLLRLSNLIKFRKEGKVVYYSLSDNHVHSMLAQGYDHIKE